MHYAIPTSSPMAPPPPGQRDEKLWRASVKFEALFLQQMMESMRKSVPESGFMPHGFAEKSYQSMMDQAIADAGGAQGSLGIAAAIYRQLKQDRGGEKQAVQAAVSASDKLTNAAMERYRAMAAEGVR